MDIAIDFLTRWLDALPALPTTAWVGLALVCAVVAGQWLSNWGMARTTGYWLAGAAFGVALTLVDAGVVGSLVGAGAAAVPGNPFPSAQVAQVAQSGLPAMPALLAPPALSPLPPLPLFARFGWIFDVALGWLLVELGQRIDLRWLSRNRAMAATAVLEYALTWALALAVLRSLGFGWTVAALGATLVAHSSPVALVTLLPVFRAEGQVTERALHLGSINTVLTAICLPVALALGDAYTQAVLQAAVPGVAGAAAQSLGVVAGGASGMGGMGAGSIGAGGISAAGIGAAGIGAGSIGTGSVVLRSGLELAQPLWLAAASMGLGAALGALLSGVRTERGRARGVGANKAVGTNKVVGLGGPASAPAPLLASMARRADEPERGSWAITVGAVCLAVGCAQWLGAPALIACLALGLSLRRRASQGLGVETAGLSALVQIVVFLVAGASLPWLQWLGLEPASGAAWGAITPSAVVLAAVLLALRLLAKTLVCTLTARWAGLRWAQGLGLGLMMQPLSITGLVFWALAAGSLLPGNPVLAQAILLMLVASDVLSAWLMRTVLRGLREVAPAPLPVPGPSPSLFGPMGAQADAPKLHTSSSIRAAHVDTALLG